MNALMILQQRSFCTFLKTSSQKGKIDNVTMKSKLNEKPEKTFVSFDGQRSNFLSGSVAPLK